MATQKNGKTALIVGLKPWKNAVKYWLSEEKYIFVKNNKTFILCFSIFMQAVFLRRTTAYVWGYKYPPFFSKFCSFFRVPIVHLEDGFLRSVRLGSMNAPPLSLCIDGSGLYFDPSKPSDLENIIQNHDFEKNPSVIERAIKGISQIKALGISKYNMGVSANVQSLYGRKTRKRILVIGQVDSDMSIIKGCNRKINSNQLVRLAASENPNAQIIYKPHPEVLHGKRSNENNPQDVKDIALVLNHDISLSDAFNTIDHVYTITSLAGFEALLREIPVTCIGAPFYSGWGITDDRQATPRRVAKRTVPEIFAAAYILYPRYFDPDIKTEITFEKAVELLQRKRLEITQTDIVLSQLP